MLHVVHLVDSLIESFLRLRAPLTLGSYEAELEASLLLNLAIRQVEATLTLARSDLLLLPAAIQTARAAFECGVRAAWMVDEPEPLQREIRWLAHLFAEVDYRERSARSLASAGMNPHAELTRASQLRQFGRDVAALLPGTQQIPTKPPKFRQMLDSIGGQELYQLYMEASQYAHGGHAATWLYRTEGLGGGKRLGETVTPGKWWLPLKLCWLALDHPGRIFFERVGQSAASFPLNATDGRFSEALKHLILSEDVSAH